MGQESENLVSNQWPYDIKNKLLSEVVGNGEHTENSQVDSWEETRLVFADTSMSLEMEKIIPGNLEFGIDDWFPPSLCDQLNGNPITENQNREYENTSKLMNTPAGEIYPVNIETKKTFKAAIIQGIVYRIDPKENGEVYTRVGPADNYAAPTHSQEHSYLNDENFSKLKDSNVLQLTRQELCQIKRKKKHANEDEKDKAIIRGIGKIAFDKLFDDKEILAGTASGQGAKATGKIEQKYDSDKVNVAAAFVACVLSQKNNWNMSMDQVKTTLQNFAAENITGLSDKNWRYFYESVIHHYAYTRRKQLSGNETKGTKRKINSKKSVSLLRKTNL